MATLVSERFGDPEWVEARLRSLARESNSTEFVRDSLYALYSIYEKGVDDYEGRIREWSQGRAWMRRKQNDIEHPSSAELIVSYPGETRKRAELLELANLRLIYAKSIAKFGKLKRDINSKKEQTRLLILGQDDAEKLYPKFDEFKKSIMKQITQDYVRLKNDERILLARKRSEAEKRRAFLKLK